MSPNLTLYTALALYAAGTVMALATLFTREKRPQHVALGMMIAGFVAHTFWIGTICVRTGHPPLTNLPEAVGFIAWTIFAVELALFIRYRVHAASFFVYPLVLMLLTLSAVVHEPFIKTPAGISRLFITHIFLTTIGVAGLLIGLAFGALAWAQDRALKTKTAARCGTGSPASTSARPSAIAPSRSDSASTPSASWPASSGRIEPRLA